MARHWADRRRTATRFKPPHNIGASTAERHNELLRVHLHKARGQCVEEGLNVSVSAILRDAVLTKNVMLRVHGVSPYQALYGRTPNLLSEFESPTATEVSEVKYGHDVAALRLRGMCMQHCGGWYSYGPY